MTEASSIKNLLKALKAVSQLKSKIKEIQKPNLGLGFIGFRIVDRDRKRTSRKRRRPVGHPYPLEGVGGTDGCQHERTQESNLKERLSVKEFHFSYYSLEKPYQINYYIYPLWYLNLSTLTAPRKWMELCPPTRSA